MRGALIVLLFFIWCVRASEPATQMWRMDFIHGGGKGHTETFQPEQLVLEPQPWTAPLQDLLQRGDYKVELFEAGVVSARYSQTYSSVYSDWSKGSEAKNQQGYFQESVRFPAPRKPSRLVISRRDLQQPGQPFVRVWQTEIRPDAKLSKAQPEPDLQVQELLTTGPSGSRLDLVFLAEGFQATERDKFFQAAQAATRALFSTEPYLSLKAAFNVKALYLPSKDSGLGGDTVLKVNPNALGMARYALTMENKRLRTMAMQVPYDNIVILTNSDQYSASGIYGAYTVVPAFEPRLRFLLVHELGHHLAGLADEYFHDTPGYVSAETVIEPYEPNVTALLSGSKLKWAHLLKATTPIPTPWPKDRYLSSMNTEQSWLKQLPFSTEVGAFQGANYSATQYYRPALNCLMFRDGGDNGFCPVCTEAIVHTIQQFSSTLPQG
jgi:hypothetical protein